MIGKIKIQFTLPLKIKKEGKLYVYSCPILDIASQGYTQKEALANLKEATILFLDTCYEIGTLEKVLKEAGFTPVHNKEKERAKIQAKESYSIPYYLLDNNPLICRA